MFEGTWFKGSCSIYSSESPPAKFNRNNSSRPIDALFGTPSIKVISAGYGPFDGLSPSAKSDRHQFLWAMIDKQTLLGKHLSTTNSAIMATRVKSHNQFFGGSKRDTQNMESLRNN